MQQRVENAKGIFFMLVAMAAFAGGDVLIKMAGTFLSPAQTMFILISSGLVIFSIIAKMNGENLTDAPHAKNNRAPYRQGNHGALNRGSDKCAALRCDLRGRW